MATYYVRAVGGDDSNSGLSFSDGWATINRVSTGCTGGDIVIVCSDATHTASGTIGFTNSGTSKSNPITIIGGGASGIIDGSVPVVDATGLGNALLSFNSQSDWIIKGIRFTGGDSRCVLIGTSLNAGSVYFVKCRIDNFFSDGVYISESSPLSSTQFVDTEIDNNGGTGYIAPSANYGGVKFVNCKIHNNAGHGISESSQYGNTVINGCLIYKNGGSGIYFDDITYSSLISNNVISLNTGDGIEIDDVDVGGIICVNNIIKSNGGYAINSIISTIGVFSYIDYNCYHNNTSGQTNIGGGTLPGDNNVTSDPLFASEVAGSEDFTLQAGSPCLNVGLGYNG